VNIGPVGKLEGGVGRLKMLQRRTRSYDRHAKLQISNSGRSIPFTVLAQGNGLHQLHVHGFFKPGNYLLEVETKSGIQTSRVQLK